MIYFAGHGTSDGIHMLDSNLDASESVGFDKMFDLLASLKSDTKIFVLNACTTGGSSGFKAASRRKKESADFIVATQRTISDAEGAWFSYYFFSKLFQINENIPSAFNYAITCLTQTAFPHSNSLQPFYLSSFEDRPLVEDDYYFNS